MPPGKVATRRQNTREQGVRLKAAYSKKRDASDSSSPEDVEPELKAPRTNHIAGSPGASLEIVKQAGSEAIPVAANPLASTATPKADSSAAPAPDGGEDQPMTRVDAVAALALLHLSSNNLPIPAADESKPAPEGVSTTTQAASAVATVTPSVLSAHPGSALRASFDGGAGSLTGNPLAVSRTLSMPIGGGKQLEGLSVASSQPQGEDEIVMPAAGRSTAHSLRAATRTNSAPMLAGVLTKREQKESAEKGPSKRQLILKEKKALGICTAPGCEAKAEGGYKRCTPCRNHDAERQRRLRAEAEGHAHHEREPQQSTTATAAAATAALVAVRSNLRASMGAMPLSSPPKQDLTSSGNIIPVK